MSSMHWEKRNREMKIWNAKQVRLRRVPGWRDKPTPLAFKKWPIQVAPHDNAGPAVQQQRKSRITLPAVSILKSD